VRNYFFGVLLLLMTTSVAADPLAVARSHSEAFARAMNARDVQAVLALYSDDARVIWPGLGEEATGKTQIESLIINTLQGFPKDSRLVLKSQSVVSIGNEHIATVSHWEQTYTGNDGAMRRSEARATEIIKLVGGKTLYVIDHASFGMPLSNPPQRQ
jgi:uncharacterized protein (TIGR02246 family)